MRSAWRPRGSRAVSALDKPPALDKHPAPGKHHAPGKHPALSKLPALDRLPALGTPLILSALLTLAAFLAGCGSGGSSSSATTAATTRTAGSAAATPASEAHNVVSAHASPTARISRAQAVAFAHAVNLRASDIPGMQTSGQEGEHHGNGEVARCLGAAHTDSLAEIRSLSFKSKSASDEILGVQSEVTVLPSAAAAAREIAAIRTPRVKACMEQIVERGLAKARTGRIAKSKPSFTWASADIPGTEGSFAVRVVMPFANNETGISASYYSDILAFASGPAIVELVADGAPQPYPSASEEHLLSLLLSRAKSQ